MTKIHNILFSLYNILVCYIMLLIKNIIYYQRRISGSKNRDISQQAGHYTFFSHRFYIIFFSVDTFQANKNDSTKNNTMIHLTQNSVKSVRFSIKNNNKIQYYNNMTYKNINNKLSSCYFNILRSSYHRIYQRWTCNARLQ